MQTDVWYELALRDLRGTDQTMLELLRDAETARGVPKDPAEDAEEEGPAS